MKLFKHYFKTVYFLVFIFLFLSQAVYAYIDPATTSYVIQIFSGIFISLGIVIGVFFKRIKMFFQSLYYKSIEKKISKQAEKGRLTNELTKHK